MPAPGKTADRYARRILITHRAGRTDAELAVHRAFMSGWLSRAYTKVTGHEQMIGRHWASSTARPAILQGETAMKTIVATAALFSVFALPAFAEDTAIKTEVRPAVQTDATVTGSTARQTEMEKASMKSDYSGCMRNKSAMQMM
jgi:hypothetical protein